MGLADLKSSLVAGHFAAAADEFGRKQASHIMPPGFSLSRE
jgi:hypothetical protein